MRRTAIKQNALFRLSFLGVILCCCLLGACSNPTEPAFEFIGPDDLLHRVYYSGSVDSLDAFIAQWQADASPYTAQEMAALTDVQKAVAEIFLTFYDPFEERGN